ncbi:Heterogeneous nuclear ribonucleoprotein L [Fasciola hepatica]|uniref:Heterogeneous nuclear ribonucleoprotein L n=1 Tax=Fasciola hepatica TaxID=6192 RepID=A0A4E0R8N9_FASHE|nr:Heterogeneous nuclear ribonucleoprotein L [Fasciola hepatica]
MSSAPKRGRYGALAIATAQFYNTTGTVPSQLQLAPDISYLITTQPSCTIVVCELPSGCSEQELLGLFSRFGQVKNAKVVCGGRAALVEFCDISTPTRLVHMAKTNPFFVGTSMVRLEFSSETINTPNESKVINEKPATTSEPTRILHLDIAAADYPITVDVIKAICSPHGQLQRIFIGKKNLDRSLEALVEFQSIEEAKTVKQQLDGADIYSGCCSLTVTYSQIPKIHVTKNDSESWDFTGPNASVQGPLNNSSNQRTLLSIASTNTGNTLSSPLMPAPMPNVPAPAPCVQPTYAPPAPSYPPHIGPSAPGTPMGYYAMPSYMPPPPHAPPPVYGQMPPHPGMYNAPTPYMGYNVPVQRPAPPQPPTQHTFPVSSKVVILPTPPSTHPVSTTGIGLGHATSNLNSSSSARPTDVSVFESMEGVVLMACNLPTHLNCDHLFNLLCLYGNIARIKFLKTRPGCAMIQVGTAEAADLIHRYYDSLTIFDRTIQFYHSKQPELTEHENLGVLDDGSPVMKNYMNDPNNRFRNVIVASRSRILEPSRTLHFFNTPLYITPDDVATVFTNAGVKCPPRIVIFTAKHGQKTSLGLVEWDTLSEALEALVLMNHYPVHVSGVSHPFHMKLAFSPKPISSDRVGQSLIRYPAPPLTTMSRERSHAPPVLETESASTTGDESASVDKRNSVEADEANTHGANGTHDSNASSQQQKEQEESAYGDKSAPHPNGNHPGDNPCSGSFESPTASQNTSPGGGDPASRNADGSQINHSVTGGYSPPASSDNDSSGSAN